MKKTLLVAIVAILATQITAAESDTDRNIRILKAENKMLCAKIEAQRKEIESLKAEIARLKAKPATQPAKRTTTKPQPNVQEGKRNADYLTLQEIGKMLMKDVPEEILPRKGEKWDGDTRSATHNWLKRKCYGKTMKIKGIYAKWEGRRIQFLRKAFTCNGRKYDLAVSFYVTKSWQANFLGLSKKEYLETDPAIIAIRLRRRLISKKTRIAIAVSGKITSVGMSWIRREMRKGVKVLGRKPPYYQGVDLTVQASDWAD